MADGTFQGYFPAPALAPAPFGLLSIATVVIDNSGNWERGFDAEYDTAPTIDILTQTGVSAQSLASHGGSISRWQRLYPFMIQADDFRSAFSLRGDDRDKRVLDQVIAVTQKAVEVELANGPATIADISGNIYLTTPGTCNFPALVPATGLQFNKAIATLENAISSAPTGEAGVMHLPRSAASLFNLAQGLTRIGTGDTQHIESITGVKISIGSGYNGNGPQFNISNKALTTNVATLTTTQNHYLTTGETVVITNVDATFNGTFVVTGTPTATTFTYAQTAADVTSIATVTGLGQMQGNQSAVWIYATGAVNVVLADPALVNVLPGDGWTGSSNTNDVRIRAHRAASVYFDPTIHYGVKINLTL